MWGTGTSVGTFSNGCCGTPIGVGALGTWWLAQLTAHHFGSPSTPVQGTPKLNGHLAGQPSSGDKVMALDQVHG